MPIFHNRAQPIQSINDTLYLIQAMFPIDTINPGRIDAMKQFLGSDVAFRVNKENHFYFCTKIEDVNFEEI